MGFNRRLQLVYPGFVFRAKVNYKNVAKGRTWTEGPLFCDDSYNYYIIEKNSEDDNYIMRSIYTDVIWTDTFYKSGNSSDIFETDIIRLTCFDNAPASSDDSEENSNISTHPENCSHPIFSSPPLSSKKVFSICGVVCFCGGTACISYFNPGDGLYYLTPLYCFFEPTGFPPENLAVEIIGNSVDNPDIAEKVFRQGSVQSRA